jgi:hypothetical protein
LLAGNEDPILHVACGRAGFNKDHCLPCEDQGRKSLLSSYFSIFSLLYAYMYIRSDATLAWSWAVTSHHDQCHLGSSTTNVSWFMTRLESRGAHGCGEQWNAMDTMVYTGPGLREDENTMSCVR